MTALTTTDAMVDKDAVAPPKEALTLAQKVVCPHCDLTVELPPHRQGFRAVCPRCHHTLRPAYHFSSQLMASVAFVAMVLLGISIFEPFMSIGQLGLQYKISLYSIFKTLSFDWSMLIWVFLMVTLICPAVVLTEIILLGWFKLKITHSMASLYAFCHRFCMVDVFVIGIAVSLIKLYQMAEVNFYSGFYTALLFSFALVWCTMRFPPSRMWNEVMVADLSQAQVGVNGAVQQFLRCKSCGMVSFGAQGHPCPRCAAAVFARSPMWKQHTLALLIAALILFVPANLFPMMVTEYLGNASASTIVDGVMTLWQHHSYLVAAVILFASLCIPVFKIAAMLMIVFSLKGTLSTAQCHRLSHYYQVVEFIGKWSMIDVFVVILMSAAVRINGLVMVYPGIAVICFCAVVLITIYAALAFDERLIWDLQEQPNKDEREGSAKDQHPSAGSLHGIIKKIGR